MWATYNKREDTVPGDDAYVSRSEPLPTAVPAADRLVAIGDIHGDYHKAVRAFRLAGLTDEHGRWSGGSTVAVQVGDILDRGDHEIRTLIMLERLAREAEAAGGRLYLLNGNHETMNVMGDHRYATPGANLEVLGLSTWRDFCTLMKRRSGCPAPDGQLDPLQDRRNAAAHASSSPAAAQMARLRPYNWLRSRALRPGSEISRRFFAARPTVLQVGDNLFVHGGVLPAHVEYGLERINRETQSWLLGGPGAPARPPAFLLGGSAIVWARAFSASDEKRCDCETLQNVLESIPGARRMVVGHTIQTRGINSACESRVIRIDVGMSHGCGDFPVEVLEVLKDGQVRRLREHGPPVPVGPAPPRRSQHAPQQPSQHQHHQQPPQQGAVHAGKETRVGSVAAGAASTAA
ncbi:hypothetical protein VOLCADRAFT_90147 [Volvox carteri f. nagariensis]|uniref:Calcineurin-like phosphoesterase domain-containing protein n=1 Tax=Volvox carteri f. nagariensis TaxID=3068 RepID=D8TTL3_VOLCA|nr:uncharacterized protein VOLCADRAFT_90147 [Volvox carteri f. nagariensis]EFJ49218.1 hypothetical protein VOLCADRAFT_90147 [Volvox carteri f. nagariensis]|eukprot:XP_002949666.1 hypothetical protein VOLCADRAFT_90147 [Volvox carteri f. nagariensis]